MILNFDEENPGYGNIPFNDGTFWRARPTQIFSQTTAVTLTAAATASVVSTVGQAGSPTLAAGTLNSLGRTLVVKFGGYLTTAASSEGTLIFFLKFGSVIVATTQTMTLAASQTTIGYYGEIRAMTGVAGASGTIQSTGFIAMSTLDAAIDPVFTNGSVAGTQAPATQSAVNVTNGFLVDLQTVLSAAVNTLVHTNTTFEIIF